MGLHETAFIPIIYAQGSDEQAKYWGPLAEKHQIIGCYAQTELGHGSNLSQLETTATLDRDTDQWIIHSTTFTASKWWIGGLGAICTHALIQARLIIDGKDYGAHGFIVPIRSLKDHRPFPGVKVGDIGPKSYGGFAKIDNGCKFTALFLRSYGTAYPSFITNKVLTVPHSFLTNNSCEV